MSKIDLLFYGSAVLCVLSFLLFCYEVIVHVPIGPSSLSRKRLAITPDHSRRAGRAIARTDVLVPLHHQT